MAVKKTQIKKDLLSQLEEKGIHGGMYEDLVDDYMKLWEIKNDLIRDIKLKGVSIKWDNGGGQCGWKKNDSITELNRTNAQMMKILNELGLKASPTKVVEQHGTEEM